MSLIRNGGFERGNTDFWEVISGGTLEVSTISPLYGSYCGKFTADGSGDGIILSSDYIDVKPYQIIDGILYIKSATTIQARLIAYFYDADYSYINNQLGSYVTNDGTYLELEYQFRVPNGASYVRFGIIILSPVSGDIFYLDGTDLEIITDTEAITGLVELLPFAEYTTSGGTYNNAKSMMQFNTYFGELSCNDSDGGDSTLDVDVKVVNWLGQSLTLASFTTVTGTGDWRIDLPYCMGKQLYIIYTITGSTPYYDFGVAVVGKR